MTLSFVFFFNDTATTEIYTLSLHDALPISACWHLRYAGGVSDADEVWLVAGGEPDLISIDRKSTRLNSSHLVISYAVFCLKKKKQSDTRQKRPRQGAGARRYRDYDSAITAA